MKMCFLGPADNYHIQKWCKWFSGKGNSIYIISFVDAVCDGGVVYSVRTSGNVNSSDMEKLDYLFHGKEIRKMIKEIRPDVICVHYASSYGTAAALSGLKNYTLSVWGSDVYEFPNKSFFHRILIKFSLGKAKYILSTSISMSKEIEKYTKRRIYITPFGVDMGLFSPDRRTRKRDGSYIVGIVKGLKPVYGIDFLLNAVALVKRNYPEIPIRLRIAGDGPFFREYQEMAENLGIDDVTEWLGFISAEEAAKEWANMDVGVIPSRQESFGVSAIEAQACGTPLIVSDAEGLLETTIPGKTSLVIKNGDTADLCKKIVQLYQEPDLRKKLGINGRKYVAKRYEINHCFEKINGIFERMIKK